jgi:uncharacterized SAM-binding protein YcdF (DUF218 family)
MLALPRLSSRAVVRIGRWVALAAILGTLAFLPFAGRFLVREDPLQRADAILVLSGTRAERLLEGYELWKEGYAPLVVLSPGREEEPAERELATRGVRIPNDADIGRTVLTQLGVPADAILMLPVAVDNTAQEGAAFRQVAQQHGWTHAIVVTSKFHTRRTRFALRRAFADTSMRITVRASRYDPADPARWWTDRADARFVISELQKLAAYRLGLSE